MKHQITSSQGVKPFFHKMPVLVKFSVLFPDYWYSCVEAQLWFLENIVRHKNALLCLFTCSRFVPCSYPYQFCYVAVKSADMI